MSNLTPSNNHSSEISVKVFMPEHCAGVGKLISTIQREEFEIPITLEQQPDLADIPGFYQTGTGNFWVAMSGQLVVGTISLRDIGNNQVALRKMFVHPDYRGPQFNTARTLLESAFEWCRSQGVGEIFLGTTAKFLAAHRFYEKNGFTEISKESLPERFPLMAVDTKFYMIKM